MPPFAVMPARPAARRGGPRVVKARGGFDAAEPSQINERHWRKADDLSADASLTPEVRSTLRRRARYEAKNNSYARGIILTLVNDTIGTGPRLQMLSGDDVLDTAVEELFWRWAEAISLTDKLRLMRAARAESGEAFLLMSENPAVKAPVTLDVRVLEADQIAGGILDRSATDRRVDGIDYDEFDNPVRYHVLRSHPGDSHQMMVPGAFESVPIDARFVIHYFRQDRPGQGRGIPDITPALPLFAMLRRYTLAVLKSAELISQLGGIVKTNAPAGGEAEALEHGLAVELSPGNFTVLPAGWDITQAKAEQPSTQYTDFKREIINEIARCLNMPFNIAAGNSSSYNYASGRLDHQTYHRSIRVEQEFIGRRVLDRLLSAVLDEAVLVSGLLPRRARSLLADGKLPNHQWVWDGFEHIDPAKEARAEGQRLGNLTLTLEEAYSRRGRDWEDGLAQIARERERMKSLGLEFGPVSWTAKGAGDAED